MKLSSKKLSHFEARMVYIVLLLKMPFLFSLDF